MDISQSSMKKTGNLIECMKAELGLQKADQIQFTNCKIYCIEEHLNTMNKTRNM